MYIGLNSTDVLHDYSVYSNGSTLYITFRHVGGRVDKMVLDLKLTKTINKVVTDDGYFIYIEALNNNRMEIALHNGHDLSTQIARQLEHDLGL